MTTILLALTKIATLLLSPLWFLCAIIGYVWEIGTTCFFGGRALGYALVSAVNEDLESESEYESESESE